MIQNPLFPSYRNKNSQYFNGERYASNPGGPPNMAPAENAIVSALAPEALGGCPRFYGEMTALQMMQGCQENGLENGISLGGVSNPFTIGVIHGVHRHPTLREKPSNQWTVGELEACALQYGQPPRFSYQAALLHAARSVGLARIANALGKDPATFTWADLENVTIDELRGIGPSKDAPVLDWILSYQEDQKLRELARGTWVGSTFEGGKNVNGFGVGFDLAVVSVEKPFGPDGPWVVINFGGRAAGTIAAALLHDFLAEANDERTTTAFESISKVVTKKDASPDATKRFVRSVMPVADLVDEKFTDLSEIDGLTFAVPLLVKDGMPAKLLGTLYDFDGPDAWVKKVGGSWQMRSAA